MTQLGAGQKVWLVSWPVLQLAAHTVTEITVNYRAESGAFSYDARTREFRVTVWAADSAAADTAASAIRTTFRNANGI